MHSNSVRPGRPHAGRAGCQNSGPTLALPLDSVPVFVITRSVKCSLSNAINTINLPAVTATKSQKFSHNKLKSLLLINTITPSMHRQLLQWNHRIFLTIPKSPLLINAITPSIHWQLLQRNHRIFLTIPKSLLLTSFSIKRTWNFA